MHDLRGLYDKTLLWNLASQAKNWNFASGCINSRDSSLQKKAKAAYGIWRSANLIQNAGSDAKELQTMKESGCEQEI